MKTAYKDPRLPAPLAVARDWPAQLRTLTRAQGETLFWILRTLYPHDVLPDEVYARAVLSMEATADADAIARLCTAVQPAWQVAFCDLAETYRVQILRSLETTADFTHVQRLGVRLIYDDLLVWQAFGYEGASVHKGGYIARGFDDLDWLPALPNEI